MNNTKLIAIIATLTLLIGIFAVIPAFSVQPPLDQSTYYVGTIGQPVRIDPARAYDTASGELLQNVYQTLIWWDDKNPVTFLPGQGHNLTVAEYSDLNSYIGVLATENPGPANSSRLIVNSTGSYWRFTINTNALFHPWVAANGSTIPPRNITAADVVYSFRRQVVYDSVYSPDWMWMTPAFGYASWYKGYGGPYKFLPTPNPDNPLKPSYNGTFLNTADELEAGDLITKWCYNIGNDVYFYFKLPWAEGVLRQIFAQTWGGVVNPDWVKEMGGWDGSFAAGWTANYHWKPTSTRSELDTYKSPTTFPGHGSKYTSAQFKLGAVGTGPYTFTSWDQTNKIWRIDAFPQYWLGFGKAGNKLGNYIHTVIEKGIDAYPTRKMLFLEGEFDVAVIPRANMFDVLVDKYNPISGINLVYNVAGLTNDVMLFGFAINPASPYQAYVGPPGSHVGGAQPFFFNNTHIRRAFAWSLNYTSYIADAYFGEALTQTSWWVDGLSPASYLNTSIVQRNLDLTQMQDELNQAIINGLNVSEAGFDVTLVYNIGNDQRLIACNLIAQAFLSLGTKFHVEVKGVDWPVFLDAENSGSLPMYDVGWLADFADPDNFCEPYQASWGAFMSGQLSIDDNAQPADQAFIDQLISDAMVEPDFTTRGNMYKDLQWYYWLDVPSFTLIQPVGRRFARDWVQGWYYNSLYPGLYAYDLYKSIVSNPAVDINAQATITPAGPILTKALIFHGAMWLGYNTATSTARLLAPENMSYNVHVNYTAGGLVANLVVTIGLKRNNKTLNPEYGETQYPNVTQLVMSPGQEFSDVFFWGENGVDQVVRASNVTTPNNGTLYAVGLEAFPVNGADSNTANNYQYANDWWAARLIGDIKSDGIVDIFDALKLSGAFGTSPSGANSANWNADADLKPDSIIDIFDAILLAGNFNAHVP